MGAYLSMSKDDKPNSEKEEVTTIKRTEEVVINKKMFITKNQGKFRDNYLIGQVLGTGAFGEVRKCINRTTKVIRAVKLIRKDQMSPEEEQAF